MRPRVRCFILQKDPEMSMGLAAEAPAQGWLRDHWDIRSTSSRSPDRLDRKVLKFFYQMYFLITKVTQASEVMHPYLETPSVKKRENE